MIVMAYTFYRAWHTNVHHLLRGNLDVFHLDGGLAMIRICSTLMYAAFEGLQRGALNTQVSAFLLVKAVFVWNASPRSTRQRSPSLRFASLIKSWN